VNQKPINRRTPFENDLVGLVERLKVAARFPSASGGALTLLR